MVDLYLSSIPVTSLDDADLFKETKENNIQNHTTVIRKTTLYVITTINLKKNNDLTCIFK